LGRNKQPNPHTASEKDERSEKMNELYIWKRKQKEPDKRGGGVREKLKKEKVREKRGSKKGVRGPPPGTCRKGKRA